MKFRIGFGVDIHQLVEGRDLIIGGVKIEAPFGALGHSDADVLLGAANLRDIGYHFADTDPKFKGIDSQFLLKESYKLVKQKGYVIGNIDCTVLLEQPKVNPHIEKMQRIIAELLEVDTDDVSIKATRGEKMGYIGNGKGVQAYCNALIYKP